MEAKGGASDEQPSHRRADPRPAKRKEADPEGAGRAPVCDRPGGVQMGARIMRPGHRPSGASGPGAGHHRLELVSEARTEPQAYAEPIESAVKEVLQYSEQEIARKGKTMRKQSLLAVLGVCLALLLVLLVLNGTIFGDGFAWRPSVRPQCGPGAGKLRQREDIIFQQMERYDKRSPICMYKPVAFYASLYQWCFYLLIGSRSKTLIVESVI